MPGESESSRFLKLRFLFRPNQGVRKIFRLNFQRPLRKEKQSQLPFERL